MYWSTQSNAVNAEANSLWKSACFFVRWSPVVTYHHDAANGALQQCQLSLVVNPGNTDLASKLSGCRISCEKIRNKMNRVLVYEELNYDWLCKFTSWNFGNVNSPAEIFHCITLRLIYLFWISLILYCSFVWFHTLSKGHRHKHKTKIDKSRFDHQRYECFDSRQI